MPRLLTQAQYARKTKYSRARITQLVKQGVIILKNSKVDPTQAEVAIQANIDRSRRERADKKARVSKTPQMEFTGNGFNTDRPGGQNAGSQNGFNNGQVPSLTEARRDHELLKMKLSEVKLKQSRGQLVPKGEATKWLIAAISATKLAFLSLPRRLAGILKSLTDEKEIEILIRSEIKKIIHDNLEEALHAKRKRPRAKDPQGSVGDGLATAR